jgi:protein-L-isoaspartate(D-aspartate) O-methyltransferase
MEARLVTCVGNDSHHTIDLFETCLAPLKNAMQPARFRF